MSKIEAFSEFDKEKIQIGKKNKEILEYYDNILSEIDIRTETLLMTLPEALKKTREELLERIKEEKEKNLAVFDNDSPLIRYKNEYFQRFIELKQEFANCDNDTKKKDEVYKKLQDLKKDIVILEDFLEDFKKRSLSFEDADKTVYASLIGELIADES